VFDFYDDYYKAARDMAWRALISAGVVSLPIDLAVIALYYEIDIVRYSKCGFIGLFRPEIISGDGFITMVEGRKTIFLNDTVKTLGRRRFTVGHELGHGILGHPLDNIVARNSEVDSATDPREMQCNVFSRDILAPACVLDAIGVTSADDIMRLCLLSRKSAEIRLERLNLLRRRGAFFTSSLERQVYNQFQPFIDRVKNER